MGIDPGLQGGIAIIIDEGEELHPGGLAVRTFSGIGTYPMPVISNGKKKTYDHLLLKHLLMFNPSNVYAILEQQQVMPKKGVKQGGKSMFTLGYGFGALKQCLVDLAIPHEVAHAQLWQKEFGISGRKGNTKAQALLICRDLFPDLNFFATESPEKPHEGIVDALLIAEFARRRYNEQKS